MRRFAELLPVSALLVMAVFAGCEESRPEGVEPSRLEGEETPGRRVSSTESQAPSTREYADVREPVVAGAFYPGMAGELRAAVESRIAKAAPGNVPAGQVTGILVPHAGYVYSADTAAVAFKAVVNEKFDLIIVLAPPHRVRVDTASVGAFDAYRTPLGDVPVDKMAAGRLMKAGVPFIRRAHVPEHAIEVELPFVQVLFPGTPILPVLVDASGPDEQKRIADTIFEAVKDRKCLVVISSDLSHYPDAGTARSADIRLLEAVVTLSLDRVRGVIRENERSYRFNGLVTAACGRNPLLTGMLLMEKMGADAAELLDYRNSGDAPGIGDKSRVVGYGAVAFFRKGALVKEDEERELSDAARKELLGIARRSIEAAVRREPPPEVACETPELQIERGVFVTIKNRGNLRGCLGNFQSDKLLWLEIHDMARSSATQDMRFFGNQVTEAELKDIDVEISVLSPLKRTDDPLSIRLGVDGIYIKKGHRTGVFLPQVATETGWSKEQFLSYCASHKAGLSPDAWKDPDTEVYTFTAEIFGEREEHGEK